MEKETQGIQDRLMELADPGYRKFHVGLVPTVNPDTVIGVRMPDLRKLAKTLNGTAQAEAFLEQLPHRCYEENSLHGLLICSLPDYETAVAALNRFLPYVDNWATCDLLSPRAFRKHPPQLPDQILAWLGSGETYTVRFGLGMLMELYLDEKFECRYLDWAAGAVCGEYYVNMMVAWYFATALAKQYAAALPFLEQGRLPVWTHNKTIQKAVESRRITPEQKAYLRTLRRKR